jgi:hypothetical protein
MSSAQSPVPALAWLYAPGPQEFVYAAGSLTIPTFGCASTQLQSHVHIMLLYTICQAE